MAVYDKEDSREFYDSLVHEAVDEEQEALQDLDPTDLEDESYYQRGKDYARESTARGLQERGLVGGIVANKLRGKTARSGFGKKIGLLVAAIFLPGMLFGLMLFGLQTGLRIQQIDRVSTGFRYAAFHRELSARLKHLAASSAAFEGDVNSASTTYSRSSLGSRLLTGGFSADAAIRSLGLEGDFEIDTELGITGRRISKITDTRTGRIYDASNLAELEAWQDVADQRLVGEAARGRFFTRRTTNYIFKKSALPFARFQSIIRDLKSGTPFTETLSSRITTEDIDLSAGRATGARVPIVGDEIVDDIRDAVSEGAEGDLIQQDITRRLGSTEKVFSIASKASTAIAFSTVGCTARDIAQQLQGAFKVRIENSQSNAAKIKTLNSQIKTDDIHEDIVNEISLNLEGFQNSATYRASGGSYDGVSGIYDFSDKFSNVRVYGLPVGTVLSISKVVEDATNGNFGLIGLLPDSPVTEDLQDLTSSTVDSVCRDILLDEKGAIVVTGIELVSTVVGAFFTGGGTVAGSSAAKGALTAFVRTIASPRFIGGTVASITFENYLFNEIIPNAINNISGLDTVFAANSGAENYASIDYGMHYLKEADCLANGCSRLPVEQFLTSTEQALALQREEYTDQGLWNNIASTDNPYSLATRVAVGTPATLTGSVQSVASTVGSILSPGTYGSLLGLSSVKAQTLDQDLLLPGQNTSLGFNTDEINGTAPGFSHIENTEWVSSRIGLLRNEYAECLSIGVVEYMLAEAGVDPEENYPSKCDDEGARRYKIYYQDCLAIEQVIASSQGESSFFNESCGDIAPGQSIDDTDERVSSNIQLLSMIDSVRIKRQQSNPTNQALPTTSENLARIFASWKGIV